MQNSPKIYTRKLYDFIVTPSGRALTVGAVVIITAAIFMMIYYRSVPQIPEAPPLPKNLAAQTEQKNNNLSEDEQAKIEKFQVFQGKDPFMPLIDLDEAEATASEGATPVEGTPSEGTPSEGGSGQTQSITLLDIYYEGDILYADIEVNGADYRVKEGDSFAQNYSVVTLTPGSATILYGDDSIVLNLGESISK